MKLRASLPPLLAGLLLAAVGWLGGVDFVPESLEYEPRLVVSPAGAQLSMDRGAKPAEDREFPGVYKVVEPDLKLALSYEKWPRGRVEVRQPQAVTTARLVPPRATLSVAIQGDSETEARFFTLPKKSKLESSQGQVRLEPGHHELLVEAEGYLPQRLSVDLEPDQRKEITLAMTALPMFPQAISLPERSPPDLRPSVQPPVYRPPAVDRPQPTYRPPPPPSRPAVQPQPRFTPIPPVAEPERTVPVPIFTPLGQ